ncbi:unnamed protein product [marine sediment metagenome]|uniref:Uncharacterized protein n=1 Tax=marine sediment metagenome TaxID=412755 RepID=X1VGR7_9ZZZZ
MFECLFDNRQLGAIGAKVVDDTDDFTIPVGIPGYITCYRCKPVGNDYSVPESKVFEDTTCPDGWFEAQPTCNPPPEEEFPWLIVAIVAGVAIVGAVAFAMFKK